MNLRPLLPLALLGLAAAPSAAPTFTEMATGPSDIRAHETNWGDYDGDGDLDLGILGFLSSDGSRAARIYRNASGSFAHDAVPALFAYTEGPFLFGDYDRDGDLDAVIGGWNGSGTGTRLYRNDGAAPFVWLDNGLRGMKGADAAWGDIDNDGDLDLVAAGESYDPPAGDYTLVYRNDGAGVFTQVQSLAGMYLGAVALGDFDRDGDLDLAVCGRTVGARIYRNVAGVFSDLNASLPSVVGGMLAWADIDADGDLDLALGGYDGAQPLLRIYRNDAGSFVDLAAGLPGAFGGRLSWGDFDNDGDPDLLVTGEAAGGAAVSLVYRNDGGGVFVDAALGFTGVADQSSGAWGDCDNDGDLDVVLGGYATIGVPSSGVTKLYRNDSTTSNGTPSAPAGLGASRSGNDVTFHWGAGSDAETPTAALTYNLRVGTAPGGQDVMAAMSDPATGFLHVPAPGNAQQNLAWRVRNLPAGTYYFRVQSVDAGFRGSAWSAEQSVVVPPGLKVIATSFASGASLGAPPTSVSATFDGPPDPLTVNELSVLLVRAGADATLGTSDDVFVKPAAVTLSGNQVTLDLSGNFLPNDQYRLRVRGDEIPVPGIANHWAFEEGSGTSVADTAGPNPGVLQGGTSPAWAPAGRLGSALQFAGLDDRVQVGAADLPVPWTASLWVRRSDAPAVSAALMESHTASLRLEQYNGTNQLGITIPTVTDVAFSPVAPLNTWIHLAFIGESDGTGVWINGVQADRKSVVMGCPRIAIGSTAGNSMSGLLDDVRLYPRRLQALELRALASLGGSVRDAGGSRLDGEPQASFPSGNGVQGGDFSADFTLNAPLLRVTGMTPAHAGTIATAPSLVSLAMNVPPDPATITLSALRVTRAGPDAVPGTGDDVAVLPVSLLWTGSALEVALPPGLPEDRYRVVLLGAETAVPGIRHEWRLNEGQGLVAGDPVSTLHGALGGPPGGGIPVWAVGRLGSGLQFNGGIDRVGLGSTGLSPPWTVSLWIRREDTPATASALLDGPSSLRLEQHPNTGKLGLTIGGVTDVAYGASAPLKTWTHLAFVGEASGTSLFLDGVFSEKLPLVIDAPRAWIGAGWYDSLLGTIDEIRIYDRVLAPGEIATLASLGDVLRSGSGRRIDGEFSGSFPSGNGGEGGDFDAWFEVSSTVPPSPTSDLVAGACGLLGVEFLLPLLVAALLGRRRPSPARASLLLLLAAGLAGAQEAPPAPPAEPPPAQEPASEPAKPDATGIWATARVGAWFTPLFEASTAAGGRKIEDGPKANAGIDLDYRGSPWFVRASFDYAETDDARLWAAGLHSGLLLPLDLAEGLPAWAGLSVGAIGGGLDVDHPGFGDFEAGIGFQVRGEIHGALSTGIHVSAWADVRVLSFDYEEPVLTGDREAGGPSFAAGGALSLRF